MGMANMANATLLSMVEAHVSAFFFAIAGILFLLSSFSND